MGAAHHVFDVSAAWTAAVAVTAAAYGVDAALIAAETRGRGPRPPRSVWQAKKMAVHLAVVLAGCDYAALARRLGMHKDTVSSHCAAMREVCACDDDAEALSIALEVAAKHRLMGGASVRALERAA